MEIKTLTQDDYDIIISLWERAGLSYRPNGKRGRKIICTLIEDWNKNSLKLFKKCNYVLHRDIFYLSKRENKEI